MGYYYAYCYCRECIKMDLSDRSKYDSNKAWCSEYRRYINPNDRACCSEHFIYNESLKSSSGCYITTIVCNIMGYSDDCEYLKKLRNFRDNYMIHQQDLHPILYEYDIVGPKISKEINNDVFKHIRSLMIMENYIKPIVKLLDENKYTLAIEKYKKMVTELKDFYKIDDYDPTINFDNIDINILGHGRMKKISV